MDFFDSIPVPEWPEDDECDVEVPEWEGPPSGILGVPVPAHGIVVRTEHVAIALAGMLAFPSGVELSLRVAVRRGTWSRERWTQVEEHMWDGDIGPRGGARRGQGLAIGIELADGSRTSTAAWPRPDDDAPPAGPVFTETGGGGGMSSGQLSESEREIWLWPLPAGATFDLVTAWPALEVAEHRLTVDAASVREAAARAEPYWT